MGWTQASVPEVLLIKGTAKLNFFSLHKMKQSPTEKVRDFWTKVQLHMDRVKDSIDVQEQVDALEKSILTQVSRETCGRSVIPPLPSYKTSTRSKSSLPDSTQMSE